MYLFQAKSFQKSVRRLPASVLSSLEERLEIFTKDPFHPILHNHALAGKYKGCRSIRVTGDYRIIFIHIDAETVRLLDVDTHHNLYGS